MFISMLIASVFLFHTPAIHSNPLMLSYKQPAHEMVLHRKPKYILGQHYTVDSTGYDACSSGSIMATGVHTYFGAVANNFLPLYTWIKMDRSINGKTIFRVMDRIGSGSQLDVWFPGCTQAISWGRREVGFTVIEYNHK